MAWAGGWGRIARRGEGAMGGGKNPFGTPNEQP